jgi:hypothetical protein
VVYKISLRSWLLYIFKKILFYNYKDQIAINMNFLILAIFIEFILGDTGYSVPLTSAIYKNGKMYIYEPVNGAVFVNKLYVYALKDGKTSDIKPDIVNITNTIDDYNPQFLNLPPGLPNGRSDQLWMMGALYEDYIQNKDHLENIWTGQILNDNQLKFDSSFIRRPDFKNFPTSAFSITTVNNNNNPVLYVIGGLIYSEDIKSALITNYIFKYEFKTDTWSDLSDSTKSVLQPVAYHKVIQVDSSLILVGGATQYYATNGNFTHTVPSDNSTLLSISDIYKFDLSTEKWSLVNVKLNFNEEPYEKLFSKGLSLDIYDGKLLSYMTVVDSSNEINDPKLATLDYKANSWEWTWIDVKSDTGIDNSLKLYDHHTLIINDQLILFHGK